MNPITFRVDGHLFRVLPSGEIQYFQPNFDPQTGLAGLGGFWKNIKKIGKKVFKVVKKVAPVAALAYGGYAVATAQGATLAEKLTNVGTSIVSGARNVGSAIAANMPSTETLAKAATVGLTLLATSNASKLAKLGGQQNPDGTITMPDGSIVNPNVAPVTPMQETYVDSSGNPVSPDVAAQLGVKKQMDTTTMLLLGGGALVLLLALKR